MWTSSIAVADVNGDGWVDIIVGNGHEHEPNQLILNDGAGGFLEEVQPLPGSSMKTTTVILADLNNDRWIDIIVGNIDGSNQVIFNDGKGGFDHEQVQDLPGGPSMTASLAVADVNKDGWLDIIVGNHYGERNQLILNGPGGFKQEEEVQYLPGGLMDTRSIAVADVNFDK